MYYRKFHSSGVRERYLNNCVYILNINHQIKSYSYFKNVKLMSYTVDTELNIQKTVRLPLKLSLKINCSTVFILYIYNKNDKR